MKTFNEIQTVKTLDNGLTVIVQTKSNFKTTSALLGTYFGALTLKQKINDELITYPAGIAHFLEHKLFEPEEEDVLVTFTNMGASANAFTSYHETVCYFSTTQDYQFPLKTLLDFVQNFNSDEEKTEKEKGIISQELLMYQQIPQFQLFMTLFRAMYHNIALNQDIAGNLDSVKATTLEDVMTAYRANYHPSQMVLSIVTDKDADEILDFVTHHQAQKSFTERMKLEEVILEEPLAVVDDLVELVMDVNATKVAVGFKQKFVTLSEKDIFYQELYLKYLMDIIFSPRNPKYQEWMDQKIINDSFNYQYEIGLDYGYLVFVNETEDHQSFKDFLVDQLSNITITTEDIEPLKRRYYRDGISALEDADDLMVGNFRAHKQGINIFEQIEALMKIELSDIQDFVDQISTDHFSMVKIKA